MPHTIDIDKMQKQVTFDVSAQQGTATGIPVKQIPFLEFPKVVYKHPKQAFRTIFHRNDKQEVVREEVVANEHLTKLVQDKKELKAALDEGWNEKPYIPEPVKEAVDEIYA